MSVLLDALARIEARQVAEVSERQQEAELLQRAPLRSRSRAFRVWSALFLLALGAAFGVGFQRYRVESLRVTPVSDPSPSERAHSEEEGALHIIAKPVTAEPAPPARFEERGISPSAVERGIPLEASAPQKSKEEAAAPSLPSSPSPPAQHPPSSSPPPAAAAAAVSPLTAPRLPSAPPSATPRFLVSPSVEQRYRTAWRAWEEGRLDEARAALDALLSEQPNHRAARLLRVMVLDALGEQRAAQAELAAVEMATADRFDPALIEIRARLLLRAGATQKAKALLESAVQNAPRSLPLWSLLGVVALTQGDGAAAQRAYEALVALEPKEARWWLGLVAALEQQGKTSEAEKVRQRMREAAHRGRWQGEWG